jgi:glycerophosphoryl diester phosphodiesterase
MKPFIQPVFPTGLRCVVIGHRGAAAVRPENTLVSFRAAQEAGASMIELDVQQSTDGEIFVFHDDTLERLCRTPHAVAELSWSELASRTVGCWNQERLAMPRLAEVFLTFQRSLLYNIELKTDMVPYPGIEQRLVELVRAQRLAERVLVSSFHHDSLGIVRKFDKNLALGLLFSLEQGCHLGSPEAMVTCAQEVSCLALHPDFRLLRLYPAVVEQCHAAGLYVFPWTVDHPHLWRVLVEELGVDGIITNDPGKLYEWLLGEHAA